MNQPTTRKSWDTNIKHFYRLGLEDYIPTELKQNISKSNRFRWRNEPNHKYHGCEMATWINSELVFFEKMYQASKIKKTLEGYFELCNTLHHILSKVKGVKPILKEHKELIVNAIEKTKTTIPTNVALKVFNLSRSTYQSYKVMVIHKCEPSYFKWCSKRFSGQLLAKEVAIIKHYMQHKDYQYWSKASIYLKAVRDTKLKCSITTFYKYCKLLGFNTLRKKRKSDYYQPIKTAFPNELWCADVTVFKTADGSKHYIHFLMDHYSKMILGYSIEKNSSGVAIKKLLQNAYIKYKPQKLQLLTDAGSENLNASVFNFLQNIPVPVKHMVAQKNSSNTYYTGVVFSNSMIEALNKIIKHQFLYPKNLGSGIALKKALKKVVQTYNTIRPQNSLGGNTPYETFNNTAINFSVYSHKFKEQKSLRIAQNKNNQCTTYV